MKSVCACLAVTLLAMIPAIAGECGVYDRIVIQTDGFCAAVKNRIQYRQDVIDIGGDLEDGDYYTWLVNVEDQVKKTPQTCSTTDVSIPSRKSKINFNKLTQSASTKKSKCGCYGRYEITRQSANENKTFTILYLDQTRTNDPYHSFTTKVIQKLLKHQYYYLHMSHFFQSADNYFPNVAKFFRGYVDRALEMAENGIKYTLAKKETLALMHGISAEDRLTASHYPMHDLFHNGRLSGSVFPSVLKMNQTNFFLGNKTMTSGFMEEAFGQAAHWEKVIMSELVEVSRLADGMCDTELGEYISAEMMPGQRVNIKLLESHRQTLHQMGHDRVAEFLFDSQL